MTKNSDIKLILGDCIDVVAGLEPSSVDAIITDVPYGTTKCKWDTIIPFPDLWRIVKHALKPKGVFVTTSTQPFTSALIMSNPERFKYCWYWKKERGTGFILSNRRPLMIVEDILVFYETQPTYNPQRKLLDKPYRHVLPIKKGKFENETPLPNSFEKGERKYAEYTHDTPTQFLEFSRDNACIGSTHPTQKPVALFEYLVKTYTNEGDTVLDICMGSGTTMEACVNTGRRGIGIEKEQKYYDIAVSRLGQS